MKILIIDDNKDITKMLSKYMTIKGHSCSVVNDGRSGLNLIENKTFDVVILDLAMPKFSGSDIIDALYKSGKIKNQNIITLTASSLSDDAESNMKSKGVRLCLKKPIDPDVLLGHMQQFENIKNNMKGLSMKDTHVIREAQQIKVLADKITKAIKIIKSKKLEPSFEPSMKTLMRIMNAMTEKGVGGKTQLSLDTHLNYTRLAKHIVWLEKKDFAESTIEDNKINVSLTAKGREFASMISD